MSEIPGINAFVNIETLFVNEQERNIYSLAKVYEQPRILKEKIRKISKGILDNNEIISGKNILLKPNWVTNNRKENDDICLRTNNNLYYRGPGRWSTESTTNAIGCDLFLQIIAQ